MLFTNVFHQMASDLEVEVLRTQQLEDLMWLLAKDHAIVEKVSKKVNLDSVVKVKNISLF